MVQSALASPQLSLLGGFDLACGDQQLPLCTSGQRLLAYLAVHCRTRAVRRTAVAERLWCDAPPKRAASSLRSVLWRLPRPHGRDLVSSSATCVRLASDVEVDLWNGEEQARNLRSGTSRPLAGLDRFGVLTSDLLPDWCEDWLLVEQETYRQTRLHALEQLSAALRAAGRYPDALSAGLAAVACEPLRESAHRRVIEVHLAEGNHSEALRQYQSFRRLLADELGLPPSPAIRRLVASLLGRPIDDDVTAPVTTR